MNNQTRNPWEKETTELQRKDKLYQRARTIFQAKKAPIVRTTTLPAQVAKRLQRKIRKHERKNQQLQVALDRSKYSIADFEGLVKQLRKENSHLQQENQRLGAIVKTYREGDRQLQELAATTALKVDSRANLLAYSSQLSQDKLLLEKKLTQAQQRITKVSAKAKGQVAHIRQIEQHLRQLNRQKDIKVEGLRQTKNRLKASQYKIKTRHAELRKQLKQRQPEQKTIADMFKSLRDRLDERTFEQYGQLNQLLYEYDCVFKRMNFENTTSYRFGYFVIVEQRPLFVDVTSNDVYFVKSRPEMTQHLDACKALIEGNQATVVYCYSSINQTKSQRQLTKKKSQFRPTAEINPALKKRLSDCSFLLIGAQHAHRYRDALRVYNKDVKVIDPYEVNPTRLFKQSSTFDYVFVFLDSCPHSVTDYLKVHEQQHRIQTFYRATPEMVVARANYVVLNDPTSRRVETVK